MHRAQAGSVLAVCDPLAVPEAPGELRVLELRTCAYAQQRGAGGAWVSLRRFETPDEAAAWLAAMGRT